MDYQRTSLDDVLPEGQSFPGRPGLTTSLTLTPSLAGMSINPSVLNKSTRPSRRSLMRGCVTQSTFPAFAGLTRLDVIAFCT